MSRFLTTHQHNMAIECHSRWVFWKIQDRRPIKNTQNTEIKYNSEKQTMQNTAKQNHPGSVTS